MEEFMSDKEIVLTMYGTEDSITSISIGLHSEYGNVLNHCKNINELELENNKWIYASIVKENEIIAFRKPLEMTMDIFLSLDDRSIQEILREVDSQELATALKGVDVEIQNKIFKNMSERASVMLKEDMEYMGPVLSKDVKLTQMRFFKIIKEMESRGEIVFSEES
jgi:flagellar motor switch protein FliG